MKHAIPGRLLTLTPRQLQVLQLMAKQADKFEGELVYERGIGFLDLERISGRTVFALLRACAISIVSDSTVGQYERYHINETGRKYVNAAENERWRKAAEKMRQRYRRSQP